MTPISPMLWGILAAYGALTGLTLLLVLRLRKRVGELEATSKESGPLEEPGAALTQSVNTDATGAKPADEDKPADTEELRTRPFWQDRPSPDYSSRAPNEGESRIKASPDSPSSAGEYRMDPDPGIGETRRIEVAEYRPLAETTAAVAPPRKPMADAKSFQSAVAAYNALAANVGQGELEAFKARWKPRPMARAGADSVVYSTSGEFWLIPTIEAGDQYGLVVPGEEIIWKWDKFYRSLGSMAARNALEGYYDVSDGAPLRIAHPAVAEASGDIWRVATPGAFAEY